MVQAAMYKTSIRRKNSVGVVHQCPYCLTPFIGVRQKKYCSKSCLESAWRVRKSALIDALTMQFGVYGLKRAQIERCANLFLERCQDVAADLDLHYFETLQVWETRPNARILYGVI